MTTIQAAPQTPRVRLAPPTPGPSSGPQTPSRLASDAYVAAPRPSAPGTFKDLSSANRSHLAAVQQAKDATHKDPTNSLTWQQETASHLDWLTTLEGHPAFPMAKNEILKSWLDSAAQHYLEARPLPTQQARSARFNQLFAEFHARPTLRSQALVKAASQDTLAGPAMPLSATSAEIQARLAPATAVLAASKSPLARELASRLASGELSLHMVSGKTMGIQFYAVVNSSKINLSNGQEGPNFFELSPPFQAATLLHEYTHVKQKQHAGSFLTGIGGNLVQRSLGLASRVAGSSAEQLDAKGRGLNANEQEAYRAEKAFLTEMGLGSEGLNVPDLGMLAGIDDWLEAARP